MSPYDLSYQIIFFELLDHGMIMREEYYTEVIQKALGFIRNNLSEPITVAQVAKSVGYSESRIKSIFNDYARQGVQAHILSLRMERAKHLLSQTKLGIAEIAFESGFNSHEQFCRIFRKRAGLSPSAFRSNTKDLSFSSGKDASQHPRTKDWIHDQFEDGYSTRNWGLDRGKISFDHGFAEGKADELFVLTLKRALPENFELSMELQVQWEEDAAHFFLSLHGESTATPSYQVVLDKHDQQACIVKQLEVARQMRPLPAVAPGEWYRIRVRLHDDTLWVLWNDRELFKFQSDFPFPYNSRSRLSLRSWRSRVRFRNVQIRDLGFPPMVRGIRQGDALYNAEDYIAARSFYQRLLETDVSFEESVELYYKIGMCFLSQDSFAQARSWLHRASALAAKTVWSQRAQVWLVYLDWLENREGAMQNTISLGKEPGCRDEMRMALQKACIRLHSSGRFGKSIEIHEFLLSLEESSVLALPIHVGMAEELQWANDLLEAEKQLRHVIQQAAGSGFVRTQALHDLSFVYSVLGRVEESESCSQLLRDESAADYLLAGADAISAFNFRGQDKAAEALDQLDRLGRRYEHMKEQRAYAKLEAALILSTLGRTVEARTGLAEAAEICPHYGLLQVGTRSMYHYPVALAENKFEEACNLLLIDARIAYGSIFLCAMKMTQAGMITEMAGEEKKAHELYAEITRRFPPNRCAFFAGLAEDLLKGQKDQLFEVPLGAQQRSEMLYLGGLLCEKRGAEMSKKFYEQSIKEDLSLRWPAYLSKKKLGISNPPSTPQR